MAKKKTKNTEIVLDVYHSKLKGVALVPPEWRKIDFSKDINEADKSYLLKNGFAEVKKQDEDSVEK